MKKLFLLALASIWAIVGFAQNSTVYFTKDITPESLVKIYEALGVAPQPGQRVAVKISTGESAQSNHLRPEFIKDLVQKVNGNIVECNTAYGGNRSTTARHKQTIAERGYGEIATVDIMDEDGDMQIPVTDTKWIKHDIVGTHLANYDFMINLAHFKGHAMGGFGGVLKNQSIGVASKSGKAYIHSAGSSTSNPWGNSNQDSFLESMAAAAQAVHNYFKQEGKDIIYINVMNNLSVDCDCDGSPASPQMKDIGILASTDPVALDKACLDLVFNYSSTTGDDASPLQQRINRQYGTYIVDYAEQIGLGTKQYQLIDLNNMEQEKTYKVKISFKKNGEAQTLTATFDDNATSRALVAMMPMTLPMLDLYDDEMCYRFTGNPLPTDNVEYYLHKKGEIFYWPPGPSFVIRYVETDEWLDIQHIGQMDSGVDILNGIGDTDMTFELIGEAAGVRSPRTDAHSPAVYTPDGRKAGAVPERLPSGLYVVDGKKKIIKQ